jgi:choline dehydrogenase-like flavoprotein
MVSGTLNLQVASSTGPVFCDVCVIGAGAGGLYAASRLAEEGFRVVVIEAGGQICRSGAESGFDVAFLNERYVAAIDGRAFGVGGTTSKWGGLLIPHTKFDLRDSGHPFTETWSKIVAAVADASPAVLGRLGHHPMEDFTTAALHQLGRVAKDLEKGGLEPKAALHLPPRKKNFAFLLKRRRAQIRLLLNATARVGVFEAQGTPARLRAVRAVARNGNTVNVVAKRFVLAAGAIESARILLEAKEANPELPIPQCAAIGEFLSDHLSTTIAEVAPEKIAGAVAFLPFFSQGRMRSLRLIDKLAPSGSPRAFAHFGFTTQSPGFAVAREMIAAVQARRLPRLRQLVSGRAGLELMKLAAGKYMRSTLYRPRDLRIHLQLDVEQAPRRANRIALNDQVDADGRRGVSIDWAVGDDDVANVRLLGRRMIGILDSSCPYLAPLLPVESVGNALRLREAYHPVGTCRMGTDPEAVVDLDLKVYGLSNLWVVSTGVLPSAGTANPTFTMLCLAERLVGHMSRETI